jgi:hypothetical protein
MLSLRTVPRMPAEPRWCFPVLFLARASRAGSLPAAAATPRSSPHGQHTGAITPPSPAPADGPAPLALTACLLGASAHAAPSLAPALPRQALTVDGQPLVQVLALGQHHGLAQVAAAQRRFGIALQLAEVREQQQSASAA